MADYQAAFEAGLAAAAKAERARKEVDEVFSEIEKQIADQTGGLLQIRREEFEKPLANPYAKYAEIFGGLARETLWTVAARNPKAEDTKWRRLAKWEQDPTGYPCTLSWGGATLRCHDRPSLEAALVKLLQDPVAAETLQSLMKLPPANLSPPDTENK